MSHFFLLQWDTSLSQVWQVKQVHPPTAPRGWAQTHCWFSPVMLCCCCLIWEEEERKCFEFVPRLIWMPAPPFPIILLHAAPSLRHRAAMFGLMSHMPGGEVITKYSHQLSFPSHSDTDWLHRTLPHWFSGLQLRFPPKYLQYCTEDFYLNIASFYVYWNQGHHISWLLNLISLGSIMNMCDNIRESSYLHISLSWCTWHKGQWSSRGSWFFTQWKSFTEKLN